MLSAFIFSSFSLIYRANIRKSIIKKPPRLKFADDSGTGLTKAPELNKPLNRPGQSMLFPSIPPTIFRYHTPTCPALVVKRLISMFSRVRSLLYPSKREFYHPLPYIGLEQNSSAEKVEIRHRQKKTPPQDTCGGVL